MGHTIYLVGARAAGKTTFGGALARQLGCNYVDTDIHLRETTGETVADIVAREGWDGFRKRESAVLRAVTYLSAPAEVLASRLQANPNAAQRPTLTGKSIAEEVAEVLAAREPLYRETATHILNAAATPKELLAEALAILKP